MSAKKLRESMVTLPRPKDTHWSYLRSYGLGKHIDTAALTWHRPAKAGLGIGTTYTQMRAEEQAMASSMATRLS